MQIRGRVDSVGAPVSYLTEQTLIGPAEGKVIPFYHKEGRPCCLVRYDDEQARWVAVGPRRNLTSRLPGKGYRCYLSQEPCVGDLIEVLELELFHLKGVVMRLKVGDIVHPLKPQEGFCRELPPSEGIAKDEMGRPLWWILLYSAFQQWRGVSDRLEMKRSGVYCLIPGFQVEGERARIISLDPLRAEQVLPPPVFQRPAKPSKVADVPSLAPR